MKFIVTLILSAAFFIGIAQDHGFPYGQINYKDFGQLASEGDSSAIAIVLNEFGDAYLRNDGSFNLIFEHHYMLKILKQSGVEEANIAIPLLKSDKRFERLLSVKASSYNIANNRIERSDFDSKDVFNENTVKYVDYKKFTIPNVRVGSIIEVIYTIESPFLSEIFEPGNFNPIYQR